MQEQKQITIRLNAKVFNDLDMYILGAKMKGEKISKNLFVATLIEKALKELKEKHEKAN